MGLFDFLKAKQPQQPIVVQKGIDPGYAQMIFNQIGKAPVMGEDSFQTYVEKGYQYNADIYSVINLITRKAATAPPVLYEVKDDKAFQKYKAFTSNISKSSDVAEALHLRTKALEEVSSQHPIIQTLLNPNELQSYYEFMDNYYGFKLITGNTYMYGVGPVTGINAGKFKQLYILPAHLVRILSNGRYDPVSGYTLTTKYDSQDLPAEKVMHSKYWNPDYSTEGSHLYGQSPLRAALRVMQQSNDAQTASMKLFQNTGAMGILYDNSEDGITPEQAYELQRKWQTENSGPDNSGKIVVTSAKIGWQQLGLSPVDLAIIDSQKMNLRQICNVYKVNSALLNDPDNKTYNNMYEARKALISDAILPELISARSDLNKWLVEPYKKSEGKDYFLDFDLSVFPELQEDKKEQIQYLERAWWLTPNQKLEEMGYGRNENPLMDNIYVSIQVTPIDKMNLDAVEQAAGIAAVEAQYAKSEKSAKPMEEEKPMATFETMAKEHNDKHPKAKVTAAKLEEVFKTGVRVFGEQNLRGNENAFAMSFVKRFLEALVKRSSEKAESYNDYPEAAVNNAKRALAWAEKNGWGECGTPVGKQRASQLANKENISRDTIARMASFKRHQQNKDVPYEEGCGGLMWDAWGGTAGIEWAINKLKQIDKQ
jgi:HK97 family phage portal protein